MEVRKSYASIPLIQFPFPLVNGTIISLSLPVPMNDIEAKRIYTFLLSISDDRNEKPIPTYTYLKNERALQIYEPMEKYLKIWGWK